MIDAIGKFQNVSNVCSTLEKYKFFNNFLFGMFEVRNFG